MNRTVLALVAILFVALAIRWLWPTAQIPVPVPAPAPSGRIDSSNRGTPATNTAGADAGYERREPQSGGEESTGAQRPAGRKTVVLSGCCLKGAEPADTPCPGLRLSLRVSAHLLEGSDWTVEEARAWSPVPDVVTGADGEFTFRFEAPKKRTPFAIVPAAPWVVDLDQCEFDPDDLEGSEDSTVRVDAGNLMVWKGFRVSGKVINERGEPVANNAIYFGLEVLMWNHQVPFASVTEGQFDFGFVKPGVWTPNLAYGNGTVVRPSSVAAGPDQDSTAIQIVVHEPPSVAGIVLDPKSKRPVAGYRVHVAFPYHGWSSGFTDSRGRFRLFAGSILDTHFRFEFEYDREHPAPCLKTHTRWRPMTESGSELVLWLCGWPEFQVRVRSGDGRIVEDGESLTIRSMESSTPVRLGSLSPGVSRWTGVPPGSRRIRIVNRVTQEVSELLTFDPRDFATQPLEVQLRKPVVLKVLVKGAGGESVVGKLSDETGGAIAVAESDERGVILLRGPAPLQGRVLRVGTAFDREQHITLTAAHERTGRVEVTFAERVDIEDWPRLCVVVRGAAGDVEDVVKTYLGARRVGSKSVVDLHEGYTSLPTGEYEVVTWAGNAVRASAPFRRAATIPLRVVGTTSLTGKRDESIEVDLPELAPGRLHGTVSHAGRPLAKCHLQFWSVDGLWSGATTTDALGAFRSPLLPAGPYHVQAASVVVTGVTPDRCFWFPGSTKCVAGADTEVVLRTVKSPVRLRILLRDGTPAANQVIYVFHYGPVRTDQLGRMEVHGIPPGGLEILLKEMPSEEELKGKVDGPFGTGVVDVLLR